MNLQRFDRKKEHVEEQTKVLFKHTDGTVMRWVHGSPYEIFNRLELKVNGKVVYRRYAITDRDDAVDVAKKFAELVHKHEKGE